jgi:hypothetical protein
MPSIFTFDKEMVRQWLFDAKADCTSEAFKADESLYGGPPFDGNDDDVQSIVDGGWVNLCV